jgi:lysophospholipase L1-like esterase
MANFAQYPKSALAIGKMALLALSIAVTVPALAAKGGGGGGGADTGYFVGGSVSGLGTGNTVSLMLESPEATESEEIQHSGDGDFIFSTALPRRSNYTVTVAVQPAGVSCLVENGSGTINRKDVDNVSVICSADPVSSTYTVGGSLSGLIGSVTLSNAGETLVLNSDGDFFFPTGLADGTSYNVLVSDNPEGQRCTVTNGSGTIAGSDVFDVGVTCETLVLGVTRLEGAGDSIMRGYNASCTGNTGFFDLFCYSGGDQNQNSFLDGSSSSVTSLLDLYLAQQGTFSGGKAASESGSEMTAQDKNNFATQAAAIVASTAEPTVVVVELGGNDLCNRTSDQYLYDGEVWRSAVQAGLDILVNNLPDGSTVYLSSVPRVQDLRGVGLAKQTTESGVDCESFWASFGVCTIATASDTYLSALEDSQALYNDILAEEADSYNRMATETGVEVVAEHQLLGANSGAQTVGNYAFAPSEINGGDCFHPSISGQNKLSEILWNNNPFK